MPKIACCATLARLGCVTFLYDMIGMPTTGKSPINWPTASPSKDLISKARKVGASQRRRAPPAIDLRPASLELDPGADFSASLPDADPKRIGVTGGSGGGTQTIILGALDPRSIVSFPNGMVSSSMQGGCICENASLLRIGTGTPSLPPSSHPNPLA